MALTTAYKPPFRLHPSADEVELHGSLAGALEDHEGVVHELLAPVEVQEEVGEPAEAEALLHLAKPHKTRWDLKYLKKQAEEYLATKKELDSDKASIC